MEQLLFRRLPGEQTLGHMASTQIAASNIQANAALDFSGRAERGVKTDLVSEVASHKGPHGLGKEKTRAKAHS